MKEILSKETERKLSKLEALERGGVDNWEWYCESLKDWFAENHLVEEAENVTERIIDIISDSIEEPAGRGCGYGLRDGATEQIENIILELLRSKGK